MVTIMDEIVVLKEGLCHMQICTTITPGHTDEINNKIGNFATTGINSGWTLDESAAPVECESYPGRWHYIMVC